MTLKAIVGERIARRGFFLTLCLIFAGFVSGAARPEPGADIFAANAPVLRIRIEVPRAKIDALKNDPRKYVPAVVREGETVYTNVAVHLKGAAGSFREITDRKPGLTLSFGRFEDDQRFHGLRKIHLNNSVQDPSYSTHYLCSKMFNAAGVPAARITHARVWLNGTDLGFYVVAEGFTKDFLGRYFKNTRGNLYDGGFLKEITDPLQKESGDDRKDQPDLKRLADAAMISDPAKRWESLGKVLDVDRFISFMALEALTWDWDGYMMKHNNYRIYHDPDTDKMIFFPHGMDQMFWEPDGSIYHPDFEGLVAGAVISTPEGNRLYRERLRQMFEKIFRLEVLTNQFDQLAARNRSAIAELRPDAKADYENWLGTVRERMIQRWHGVQKQLQNEPKPLQFSSGAITIKNWREQSEAGSARLDLVTLGDRPAFHIVADGRSTASWRAEVMLETGRYRFEALARTANLIPLRDQKGQGAGIRISGTSEPRKNQVTGTADWTKLEFEFDVSGASTRVLVCELRAMRGEVWFDGNSLKLSRIQ